MLSWLDSAHRLSTKKTYSSAQLQFLEFCKIYSLIPLPASEQVLLRFLAFTQSNQRHLVAGRQGAPKASSLQVYMSAISSLHVMHGFDQPPINAPRVKLLIKSINQAGTCPDQKSPITYEMLVCMIEMLRGMYNYDMYKAALTLGFFGTLRGAEYAVKQCGNGNLQCPPLLIGHVSFGVCEGVKYLQLYLPRTKTRAHGMHKIIGCSGTSVCAVCSMEHYLSARSSCYPHDYLFRGSDGKVLHKAT